MKQQFQGQGIDPARPFGSQFGAGQSQGGGNAYSGLPGNIQGLSAMQSSYNMQNLQGGRMLGGLPAAGAQQQQAAAQGRFGAAMPTGMQLGQYGQQVLPTGLQARAGLGNPMAMNGIGGPGGGMVRGGVAGPNQGLGGRNILERSSSLGLGGLGGVNLAGNMASMQRQNSGTQQAAGMNLGALSNQQRLGQIGGLGGGMAGNLTIQGSPGRGNNMPALLQQQGMPGGGGQSSFAPSGELLNMISKAGVGANQLGLGLGAGNSYIGGQQQGLGMQGQDEEQPAFNQADFPSLGGGARQQGHAGMANGGGDGGGLGGAELYSSLAQQKVTNQLSEFSIETEDFPALPGAPTQRGGPDDQQDGQGQGPSGQHNQFQQRTLGMHLQGSGMGDRQGLGGDAGQRGPGGFPEGGGGILGLGGFQGLGQQGIGSPANYDQMMRFQQHQQQQMRAAGMAAAAKNPGPAMQGGATAKVAGLMAPDRFGLMGLLSVIRMTDPDLTTLALGTDLTTLGLNLNSPDALYKTFASPWADTPLKPEPEFKVPTCYQHKPPRLQAGYFSKFQQDTLFYIFYSMPGDEAQLFAADELSSRGWWYHKQAKVWLMRVPGTEPTMKTDRFERGSFVVFDTSTWEMSRKEGFTLVYEDIERAPNLPRPQQTAAGQQPAQQMAAAK